jgi:hypothetical protein
MSDEIDQEVTRLFRDMERELGLANVSDVSIAHALQEIGVAQARARERVQSVVALLKFHYDTLKGFREYQKIVAMMAGIDMILTPGFELAIRMETEKLGHAPASAEMHGMLMKILCGLNDSESSC